MPYITILGAGSTMFARQLMTDILQIEGLDEGCFALVDIDPSRLGLARQVAELLITRSHEYGSFIIEAMLMRRPTVIYGNVRNTGLIDNLPDGCVEVACLVDQNGVQPCHFGSLPEQLSGLNL